MDLLDAMRAGYSYYEAYCRAAKGWKGAPGTLKKELGVVRYTKIKNEALGCGYGMGAAKYTTYADVPELEAKQIVSDFRRTNPKVVAFWKRLDNLIVSAARSDDKVLGLQLPTGDLLKHFDVRATSRGFKSITTKGDYSQASVQLRLWGGTATENVTQRMARDVLASAVVNLEKAGLPVAVHCHDEVIIEIDDDASKSEAEKEAIRIMTTAPDWAPELPLGVEGGFETCYTK